jgi:hypothetical protein
MIHITTNTGLATFGAVMFLVGSLFGILISGGF